VALTVHDICHELSLTSCLIVCVCLCPQAPNDAPAAAQRATSAVSVMDDAGLDGFVHMHMIDDLLTE
jgi:hypothetical protein